MRNHPFRRSFFSAGSNGSPKDQKIKLQKRKKEKVGNGFRGHHIRNAGMYIAREGEDGR
jgi:hypothetical protein